MKVFKRILSLIVISCVIITINPYYSNFVKAAYTDTSPQQAPQKLRVEAINPDEPPIGYNEFDGYYVDLKWDNVVFPGDSDSGYINVHLQEVNKAYKPSTTVQLREKDLPGGTTEIRLRNLKSGTMYYVSLTAYHTHTYDGKTYNSALSAESNKVKFMTDINLAGSSFGVNQLRIEWDDVWNVGKRIAYKLYVSESSEFNNVQPLYIGEAQIEPSGPIKVDQNSGRLEYILTVNDPGRVYYIKIAPDITEANLKMNDESNMIMVSSFIVARTNKVSETPEGSTWRIDWSQVVTGLGNTDITISYQIFRGNIDNNDVPQYMATVNDTNFFVTVPLGENKYYYTILASITKNGNDVYPGIKIGSDKIFLNEQDIIMTPEVPEITDLFERVTGDTIISYIDELKPNSATVLWRVPKKGDGSVDTDITYDIWLIDNPNLLDNPPDNKRIERDFKPSSDNYVIDGIELRGYKYTVSNLTPNSTYYFKIIAKKIQVDYVDEKLQSVVRKSDPAIKVIITPSEGPIDQPLIPARPPLSIKMTQEGQPDITSSTVTISLKNKWYEIFNDETGKWEYIRTEKLNQDDIPPYSPTPETLDGKKYRVVEYDSDVTIDVGCVEYVEGMSYNDIVNITADKVTGFPVAPNDAAEDSSLNPDGKKHNVNITLTGLNPNTTYIIWVRAARKNLDLISGPSDPIVITTEPDVVPPIVKPTVPIFNYGLAGDTFVDLGWNFNNNYKYYLKYSTVENINSASQAIQVNPEDLANASFYRINDLLQDTVYFFWVQAETLSGDSKSEWSDSYILKTLPLSPPETPAGFGIKNGNDAVTKNSITFEWIKAEGMEYKLEIASDINYKNMTEYKLKDVSEFKVEGLKSNFRYYARLYAYDPKKEAYSAPTQSITVRTGRSDDDYDSDQDIENVLTGEFVVIDTKLINNIWNVSITGSNADRFIENMQKDKVVDYTIDLTNPPGKASNIKVTIGSRVVDAMAVLKENIIILVQSDTNGRMQFIFGNDILAEDTRKSLSRKMGEFNYELSIGFPGSNVKEGSSNIKFKTSDVVVGLTANGKSSQSAVTKFDQPMKILFPYTDYDWYREGKTSGFGFDYDSMKWNKLNTSAVYDENTGKGFVKVRAEKPGNIAIAEYGNSYYDDISGNWAESSINNMAAKLNLKSIEGSSFKPNKNMSLGEAVKLMLDVMNVNYGNDYMIMASRSKIITEDEISKQGDNCTREKAIAMICRLYEIKTGKSGKLSSLSNSGYKDINTVSQKYAKEVNFAIQNGIVTKRGSDYLNPLGAVTRGEAAAMIEKLLVLTGEL
ncbi:MAG TPA: S-layer homology domain-containing protein [Pseudobacteroides sp.]|nr:S-layer homology domain-containing protein [Pseudobacteroides sp.]